MSSTMHGAPLYAAGAVLYVRSKDMSLADQYALARWLYDKPSARPFNKLFADIGVFDAVWAQWWDTFNEEK